MPDYIKVSAIAQELDVDVATVKNWIKSGELKGYKFGRQYRVLKEDFQLFKDNSKQ